MNGYALDTNTISFILRGDKCLQKKVYDEVNGGISVVIPPIAYYEIKRGLIANQAQNKLKAFERLYGLLGVDFMDVDTLDKAAGIYAALKKVGRLVDDADILIAASCLSHGYTLITNNVKHFERIDGLQHENWIE